MFVVECVDFNYQQMDGLAKGFKWTHYDATVVTNLEECEQKCDNSNDCGSLGWNPGIHMVNCFLFAKALSGSEETDTNITITNGCISYYKKCNSRGKQYI